MTPLKTYRHNLSALLASALDTADTAMGAKMNPPAVIVQPATGTYLTVEPGYCVDGIDFECLIIGPTGDVEAQFDALDDLIDKVRAALRGTKFALREISGPTNFAAGDSILPAVVATVHLVRETN